MKELDSFTVEQLNNFIESDHAQCGDVAALARIALAAKRAKESHSRREVWDGGNTWVQCSKQAYDRHEAAGQRVRMLYERPQLNSSEIPECWVKCSDRMPKQKQTNRYISLNLVINNRTVVQGGFDDGRFWLDGREISGVTHWMPLPSAPENPL